MTRLYYFVNVRRYTVAFLTTCLLSTWMVPESLAYVVTSPLCRVVTASSSWSLFPRRRPPNEICSFGTASVSLAMSKNSKEANDKNDSTTEHVDDMNPMARASWYAVEAFGKLFAPKNVTSLQSDDDMSRAPSTLQQAIDRIERDNDRSYFLSGNVDVMAYAPDCTFSDPFVSFRGRDRFVENLQNLNSFVTAYSAKPLSFNITDDNDDNGRVMIQTKIMVKLELNLPWKPVLAWPWGVRYQIVEQRNDDSRTNDDESIFWIVDHKESWDIDPWEGVKQIFRKPTTKVSISKKNME